MAEMELNFRDTPTGDNPLGIFPVSDTNPLPVKATLETGDIEIGAVEIKNGTSDIRATVTANNALKVDGSAVTQPISGTVAATQDGSWTIDIGTMPGVTQSGPWSMSAYGSNGVLLQQSVANDLIVTLDGEAIDVNQSGAPWSVEAAQSGTWTVTVDSMPTVTVQGTVTAIEDTQYLFSNGSSVNPQFAAISAASAGDNTLVAAGTGQIRILSGFLVAAAAVDIRFESGAGGTALSGVISLAANAGFVLPYNPKGWFQTGGATLLNLELSAAVQVSGVLQYIDIVT